MSKPAVFLDRDGTLIEDADFLASPEGIRILPNAIPGLQKLHDAGYLLVVLTNQSGLARGLLTEEDLGRIHARLVEQIQLLGGHIDAIYYCPHLPEGSVAQYAVECDCRKPRPGLFIQARDDLDIDLERSFAVGDAWRDVEAALGMGIPAVKLPRPAGREESPRKGLPVLAEARDLLEAADIILSTTPEAAREAIRQQTSPPPTPPAPAAVPAPQEPEQLAVTVEEPPAASQVEPLAASRGELPAASPNRTGIEPPAGSPDRIATEPPVVEHAEPEFDASLDVSPALKSLEEKEMVRQSPAQEAPAGRETALRCARCAAAISSAAVASGEAGVARGHLLCPECFASVSHRTGRAPSSGGAATGTAGRQAARLEPDAAGRQAARAEPRAPEPAATEAAVREILFELRRIARRQAEGGQSFDLTWVLGVLGQTAALFLAIGMPLLRWAEAPLWLLAAVFVQIFALTMFLLSRSKK